MAYDDLGIKRIRAFCYPFWGIFRIGWVMVKDPVQPVLYYDSAPTVTLHSTNDLRYVTIGFTERGVLRRLKKYVESVM